MKALNNEPYCENCEHCAQRHFKEGLNTDGDNVCLVMGCLIPTVAIENKQAWCGGFYFDKKSYNDSKE